MNSKIVFFRWVMFLSCLLASVGQAQKPVGSQEQIDPFPRTQLAQADSTLNAALKQKNGPVIIRALLERSSALMEISQDSFPSLIKQVETIGEESSNTAEKAMLQSVLAQFYQDYYNRNQWKISSRQPVEGDASENITQWSAPRFIDKIYQLSLQSIAPAAELQKIKTTDYLPAITEGKDSRELRPTLFDFLAYRAIDRMKQFSPYSLEKFYPQHNFDPLPALSPVSEFIRLPMNENPVQIKPAIFSIFQQLLRFHLEKNDIPALIVTNINRLSYANAIGSSLQRREADWQQNLDNIWNFYNQYKENPYSTEILIYFRTLMRGPSKSAAEEYHFLKRLLDVQKEAVKKFPGYERIGCLENEISSIESPYFYADLFRENFYPNEKKEAKINYKNIRKLNIKCSRLEISGIEVKKQEAQPGKDTTQTKNEIVYDIDIPVNDTVTLIQEEKSIELPALSPGFYRLQFYADSDPTPIYQFRIYVTHLFSISRNSGSEKRTIVVTDAQSGKPVFGAKIELYKSQDNQSYQPIGTLYTDKQGIAVCEQNEASGYLVSYKNDAYLPYVNLPYKQQTWKESSKRLSLFTDRSVYRPGQRVQFSGVLYECLPKDSSHVLSGRSVNVKMRNAQSEVIYDKKMISDSLGSFSGDINIPTGSMTGDFSLMAEFDDRTNAFQSISVSEYKRPTFKVEFGKPKPDYSFKTPVSVSGKIVSYAGYALPNAVVRYKVIREQHFLRFWPTPSEQVASGETKANEQGDFTITFQPQKTDNDLSRFDITYQYRIVADATSPSGETQSGSVIIPVGDLPVIIQLPNGIQIDKENKDFRFPVSVLSLNGDTLRQNCKYILYSLYDNKDIDDLKPLDSLKLRKQIVEKEFRSGEPLNVSEWLTLPSGPYRLVVQTKDQSGNVISDDASFALFSMRDKRPPVLSATWMPQHIKTLQPGETKELIFGSSFSNVYCYVDQYDGLKLVKREIIKLSNSIIKYPVTYRPEYEENLNIFFTFVKDTKIYEKSESIESIATDRKLTIQTTVFRDKLRPGNSEEWTFTIKDSKGKPVSARFMASMYDASLNAIRPYRWWFNPVYRGSSYFLYWSRPTFYGDEFNIINRIQKENDTCIPYQYDRLNYGNVRVPGVIPYADENNGDFWIRGTGTFGNSNKSVMVGALANTEMAKTRDAVIAKDESNGSDVIHPEADYRMNFDETAFFYPDLLTDKDGNVSLRFTVPESNTEWQFMSLAYTKNLLFGQLDKKAVSNKPLMVNTNLPRFVRQGDDVSISTLVVNNGTAVQEGKLTFELFNPYTDSVLTTVSKAFILNERQTMPQSFAIHAPDNLDIVGIRVRAATKEFSDGEQQLLPVLPSRTLVTETLPFTVTKSGTYDFTLKRLAAQNQSKTLENYRLTLEYTANPVWFVVQALPSLSAADGQNVLSIFSSFYGNTVSGGIVAANPKIKEAIRIWKAKSGDPETLLSNLQKNESLKTILLSESPWVLNATDMTERMQKLSELFDTERIAQMQNSALNQLLIQQTDNGGWSWFKGMAPSQPVTLSILEGMARLTQLNMIEYNQKAKIIQTRALSYIDNDLANNIPTDSSAVLSKANLTYLYVRTSFRDIPVDGRAMPYFRKLVDQVRTGWSGLPLSEKAMAALTLNRLGFKDDATAILKSLTEYATQTKELGMFWQNNRASQISTEGAIRVHTLIMSAYGEITPDSPLIAGMKQWLLMQKQTQDWGNSPATADAIYALLMTGPDWLVADNGNTTIKWGGKEIKSGDSDLLTGYLQQTKQGSEINASAATAQVITPVNRPAWGALYWQYFEEFGRIAKTGNGLSVDKQLFVEEKTQTGSKLIPVNQTTLKPGQKLVIRLVVKCDRDLEFVHLKDQRAACFEQTQQLSGYRFQDGLGYYRENRDAYTNFFFNFLPKGEYVLTYDVWLDRTGTYNNGTTSVQCLYAPQYTATTQGGVITVK